MKQIILLLIFPSWILVSTAMGQYVSEKLSKQSAALHPTKSKVFPADYSSFTNDYLPKDVVSIGTTFYDIQNMAASDKRLIRHADGTLSFVWNIALDTIGSFPDKGTAFNYYDGNAWGNAPTARIEDAEHLFPSLGEVDGADYFVSQNNSGFDFYRNSQFGADDWIETPLSNTVAAGLFFPRTAYSNNYLHIVAISPNNGLSDMLYYLRSSDEGLTWDDPILLPGLDTNKYNTINGDYYAMDARGSTIVLALAEPFGDIVILKSTDDGDSWTKHVILDFPDVAEPYNGTNLDVDEDGIQDTFETASGDIAVILDNDGKAHVAFSKMKFAGNTFFPMMPYDLVYWNEDMEQDSFDLATDLVSSSYFILHNEDYQTISSVLDLNGNETLDIVGAGQYNVGFIGFPSLSVTEDNDIIALFSMVMEGSEYLKTNAHPGAQNTRHIWCASHIEGSQTWSSPYHITDELGFELTENVYPYCSKYSNETGLSEYVLTFVFQNDVEPGSALHGDFDAFTTNYMIFDTLSLLIGATREINGVGEKNYTVFPNPVSDVLTIEQAEHASIVIYDIYGKMVGMVEKALPIQNIDLSHLCQGTYLVYICDETTKTVKKIVKKYE